MALNKDGVEAGKQLSRAELIEVLAKQRNKKSVEKVEKPKAEKPARKTTKEKEPTED